MKKLLTILIVVGSLCFCACSPIQRIEIPDIAFEETAMPSDEFLREIEKIKKDIGSPPIIETIKIGGATYFAFSKEDMKKLEAKNKFAKLLESHIRLMHEDAKVYVTTINRLKHLSELQNAEIKFFESIYYQAKIDKAEAESRMTIDGIIYKIVIVGQMIAMIALL